MLTINTNLSSLVAQSSLKTSTNKLNQAIERMTTGFKINHASDNAAGYSIVTNMSSKLSSYEVAMDNASMGLDMITTATDSMELITSHLQRMRDLAEQAANGTYGEDSLKAIQAEIDARKAEVGRIVNNTEYNGIKFFGQDDGNAISTFSAPQKSEKATQIAVDESKRVVNQTTFKPGETYYVTNSDDLVKLQDLVNSGVDTKDVTFELTSDIDMRGVAFRGIGTVDLLGYDDTKFFKGTFNGNNHVISNLTINTTESGIGLFGAVDGGTIDSVGLENCNISGGYHVGGLVGGAGNGTTITNSYATGSVTGTYYYVGGLVGSIYRGTITNSYAIGSVNGDTDVGGLVGNTDEGTITNSYSMGSVTGTNSVGGFVGTFVSGTIINSYSMGSVTGTRYVGGLVGQFCGSIINSYATGSVTGSIAVGGLVGYTTSSPTINGYFDTQRTGQTNGIGYSNGTYTGTVTGVTTAELNELIKNGTLPQYNYGGGTGGGNSSIFGGSYEVTLQVGINSDPSSTITIDIGIGKIELNIDVTTADGARDALTTLDEYLKGLNEKQTQLGAAYNRLESVIESIGINIDNLVSSRSTLRDADIAELSSTYIQQQILQQASATLLATANQSPSIALQLL